MRLLHAIVALVAISLLLSLAWPALIEQREAMRRNTCARNLAEIGMALQKHHDALGSLPPLAVGKTLGLWIPSEGGPQTTDPSAENWAAILLPYLDETRARDRMNEYRRRPYDVRRYDVDIPRYRCPSDPFNRRDNLYAGMYPRGNYAMDAGSNDICFWPGTQSDLCPNGARFERDDTGFETWYGDGVAGYNKSFRLSDFQGGQRYMVALEEVRAGIHEFDSRGVWGLGMVGSSATHQHGLYGDADSPNNSWPNSDDVYGCKEATLALGRQTMMRQNMPCAAHIIRPRQATARSMHPGGVHCLTLDGSCHFVANDVSKNVWHVLHSRENRQSVPAFWDRDDDQWTDSEGEDPEKPTPTARIPASTPAAAFTNSIGMQFVPIPLGEYWMGVPDIGVEDRPRIPRHYVAITKNISMAVREVSEADYRRLMKTDEGDEQVLSPGTMQSDSSDSDPSQTASSTNMSWHDAAEFCARLSQLPAEVREGRSYRLPTEAEWEYACRGGLDTNGLLSQSNPNAFGLLNMRGDVWEWCSDWYAHDYYARSPLEDPQGPKVGVLRVIRGTPWVYSKNAICWQNRFPMPPASKSQFVGFRVVAEVSEGISVSSR